MIVVRENIEDLYAGIEHMLTPDVGQCLKIISRKGSERVIRYAFELARREGRRKVTCATKANIMKLTEGLFKAVFEELSPEYPEIAAEHLIIDNVAHQIRQGPGPVRHRRHDQPQRRHHQRPGVGAGRRARLRVVGQLRRRVAIFEAVHGSAPKYAGKDVINPTALILSSVMMLRHLGELRAADRIENAVLRTLQQGQAMTQDLVRQAGGDVDTATSTTGFTDAVIANLGKRPEHLAPRRFASPAGPPPTALPSWSYGADRYARIDQRTVGLDIFIATEIAPDVLGPELEGLAGSAYRLEFIESRGTKVYPSVGLSTDPVGLLRARFVAVGGRDAVDAELLDLQARVAARHPGWTHVEKLHVFDGVEAFTRAQGQ